MDTQSDLIVLQGKISEELHREERGNEYGKKREIKPNQRQKSQNNTKRELKKHVKGTVSRKPRAKKTEKREKEREAPELKQRRDRQRKRRCVDLKAHRLRFHCRPLGILSLSSKILVMYCYPWRLSWLALFSSYSSYSFSFCCFSSSFVGPGDSSDDSPGPSRYNTIRNASWFPAPIISYSVQKLDMPLDLCFFHITELEKWCSRKRHGSCI